MVLLTIYSLWSSNVFLSIIYLRLWTCLYLYLHFRVLANALLAGLFKTTNLLVYQTRINFQFNVQLTVCIFKLTHVLLLVSMKMSSVGFFFQFCLVIIKIIFHNVLRTLNKSSRLRMKDVYRQTKMERLFWILLLTLAALLLHKKMTKLFFQILFKCRLKIWINLQKCLNLLFTIFLYWHNLLKVRERTHTSGIKLRHDFKLNVECIFNSFAEVDGKAKDLKNFL